MAAAAGAHHVGVAHDNVHGLDRHLQQIRHDLREARLMALPGRLRADDDVDAALGLDGDAGLFLGRADRGFDVVGEAEAEQMPALFGRTPARIEAVPIGDAHGEVHVLLVAAAVVGHADRVAIGHGLGPHQIAAAQPDAVDVEFCRRDVDQAFDGEGHLRAAGAAIGLRRNGVGEHRQRAQRGGRDGVVAGDQAGALAERRQRHAARAGIADIGRAQREEAARAIERQFEFRHQVAALIVADEALRARGGELDRAAELARRPQHQPVFRIDAVAGAEIAADVERQHAQGVGLDAEHAREFAFLAHGAAAAGMQRVAAAGRVVIGDRRARLERNAGDAADVEIHGDDIRRLREGALGRRGIAEIRIDQNIVGHLVPDRRGAGAHGVFGMQHEGQFVVDDVERFGRIERLRAGLRHHHGDRLADVARLVGGQQHMRADEDFAAAGAGELHVVARLRQRIVRDRPKAVGLAIGAGEHAEHAGHRQRAGLVDRDDARMGVRRAHHRRVSLPGKIEVVGEAALADEQPRVFVARPGLPDEAEAGFRFIHRRAAGHVTRDAAYSLNTFATRSTISFDKGRSNAAALPLTPRRPRHRVERSQRRDVRAIILPSRVARIARKIARALPVTFAQRANALQIPQRCRFHLRNLFAVEVERRHAAEQEFGGFGAEICKPADFGGGHAEIFRYPFDFAFGATGEAGWGTIAGPRPATTA